MSQPITASILYDLVQCPKRVELDIYGDPSQRDDVSPFVEMLWMRGAQWERKVVKALPESLLNLTDFPADEKVERTLQAMASREPLIYGARIAVEDKLGVPDLLRLDPEGYIPIDIKSGRGDEGGSEDSNAKPKLHYAVQLALYVDILQQTGFGAGRRGVILDASGAEVVYDLDAPLGPRSSTTFWDEYRSVLHEARSIANRHSVPSPAASAGCKLCHWRTHCGKILADTDDLTLIPALGRSLRDRMQPLIGSVHALATTDISSFVTNGKTGFKGVSPERLETFQLRARLLTNPTAKPFLRRPVHLPNAEVEFFFDIEVDPLRDFTYLHGLIERRNGDTSTERFFPFFADDESPEAEKHAFAGAFAHLTSVTGATIWYYSKYERTIYRKLQRRYQDVCSAEDVEQLFAPENAIDLFNDVVMKATEWPTHDYSIKTLAKFLGFAWRDTDPSGAASIEWFDRWMRERDPSVRTRLLEYNEDDCRATRVLLDGIRSLDHGGPEWGQPSL